MGEIVAFFARWANSKVQNPRIDQRLKIHGLRKMVANQVPRLQNNLRFICCLEVSLNFTSTRAFVAEQLDAEFPGRAQGTQPNSPTFLRGLLN